MTENVLRSKRRWNGNEEFTVSQDVLIQNICNKHWKNGRVVRKLP